MIRSLGRAASGQTPTRFLAKTVLSTALVAGAVLVHREGFALSFLLVFSGITGPAVRLMSLRASGMLDRLLSSPAPKPGLVLGYTGFWSISTLAALAPAIAIAGVSAGPPVLVSAVAGSVLASGIGTLCGLLARSLGDAHLLAVSASLPLIAGMVLPGPWSFFLPYAAIATGTFTAPALASQAGLAAGSLILLGGLVSRW